MCLILRANYNNILFSLLMKGSLKNFHDILGPKGGLWKSTIFIISFRTLCVPTDAMNAAGILVCPQEPGLKTNG